MRRSLALPSLLALAATVSCGGGSTHVAVAGRVTSGAPSTSPAQAIPPPPPPRDDGRLPVTATPRRYALSLRVDPAQPRFSGVSTIQIDVVQPTFHIVLHARDMNVSRAVARASTGEMPATVSSRIAHGGVAAEELVLTFARALPPGTAELVMTYDAPFATDLAGAYRVEEDGAWYAYTQFEATDARRAFPCFDEPGFKTAYDVTIAAPRGTTALANSPESSHEDAPDGMVVHHFETSRPLPSYLVAFAVGDFDVAQGQTTPFPIRVVTTKGKAGPTALALDAAAALTAKLGDYFGVRYPYAKLDLVAVPDFASGAMENPGLITFRDVLLRMDPKRATTAMKRRQATTIAHELAHMWFGDLVTMKWWDDIWLNEGFATWAEAKVVDAWKPSFGAVVEQIADVQDVMDTDALRSARAVRQPVLSTSDAMESFDGMTYEKGAAVLRMLEGWLGADTFQRGVQRYIRENAWKNATADDLFASLDYVSTQKVGQLASSFLDHPGVPEVLVSWKCGGKTGGKLELRESEWRPLGAGGEPARTWTLPVCVASDAQKAKSCFTLGAEPIARDLGPSCPSWVYPNAEGAGYYRFVVDRSQLLALARGGRALDVADRLGLVSNAWAEVRQGAVDPSVFADMLPILDADMDHHVVAQITSALRNVDQSLVEDAARPAFQRYAAARLAGRKAALGWEAAHGEAGAKDDDRALERTDVLHAMGEIAGDKRTLDEAETYAQKWLKDPASVPADTASAALPLASMRAGAARLEELRAAAKNARMPEDRVLAIRAMGTFDDAAVLRRALDLSVTDELKLSELRYLFGAARGHRASRPVLYAWEKDNWTKLSARMPGSLGRAMLVAVAADLCTAAQVSDAKAFFTSATQGVEGVKRSLDEDLEQAGLCVALREHGAQAFTKYLQHK